MQNEPNFPENQANANSVLTRGYETDIVFWPKNPKANLLENQVSASSVLAKGYEADIVFWPKNPKPNQSQFKPNLLENQVNARSVLAKGYEADIVFWPKNPKANLLDAQMNVNLYITKDYENKRNWTLGENEPNFHYLKLTSTDLSFLLRITFLLFPFEVII